MAQTFLNLAQGVTGTLSTGNYTSGISEADQWRMNSDSALTGNATTVITSNLERIDTDGFGRLGTGMSESSGIFTFPSTGIWQIIFNMWARATSGNTIEMVGAKIQTCTDGSSYDDASLGYTNIHVALSYGNASPQFIFDVTNTSTHKVRFAFRHNGNVTFQASTSANYSHMTFLKLGDT